MFDRNSFLRNVKDHMGKLFIIFYRTCVRVERGDRGIDELRKKRPISFIGIEFKIGREIIV